MRQIEKYFQEGKLIRYTKFVNRDEVALSFPTEMATPFIYTLDIPTVLSFQGRAFRSSQSEQEQSGEMSMQGGMELQVVFSTKIQGQLGFITPFDHQQYSSGYERSIQVYAPLRVRGGVDLKRKVAHAEIQFLEPEQKDIRILHYSATPYIANYDILSMQPVISRPNTQIIYSKPQNTYNTQFGESTGMVFRVQYANEDKYMDYRWLYEQARHYNFHRAITASLDGKGTRYSKMAIDYVSYSSPSKKVNIRMKCLHDIKGEQNENSSGVDINQFEQVSGDYEKRCEQFSRKASLGIRSAMPWAMCADVSFEGQNKMYWQSTFARASSPVDEKCRTLFFFNKQCESSSCKPYQIAVSAKSSTPLTNEIDLLSILNNDLTSTTQIEAAFGEKYTSGSKINAHIQMRRSESRKQYLQQDPLYRRCKSEMDEGNHQLPACANLTERARYFDKIECTMELHNIARNHKNATYKVYNALRSANYFNYDEDFVYEGQGNADNVKIEASYHPEESAANITLTHQTYRAIFKNMLVNSLVKPLVTAYPPYSSSSYLYSRALGFDEKKREYKKIMAYN